MTENYLTKEGLTELRAELHDLKTKTRREIAEAIHAAKEQGDLSENAEYQQAKDEQRRIEEKIAELETTIKHARIITSATTSEVSIGNTVTLKFDGQKKTYQIVGSNEADPRQGRISNESPIGRALLHKKKGDTVSIPTPVGEKDCKVIEIS
jgi:transcription elongation factor GreA